MKYKLGSELDLFRKGENDLDLFDWHICLLDNNNGLISYVSIGNRTMHDPIVRKARELVNLLNEK